MIQASDRLFRAFFVVALAATLGWVGCSDDTASTNNSSTANNGRDDAGRSDADLDGHSGDDVSDGDDAGDDRADGTDDQDVEDDAYVCGGTTCGDQCCTGGQECIDDRCLPACAGTRCGADLGLCCTGGDVCLGDQCVPPGADCERTEECPVDSICEPTLGQCVPREAVDVCEFVPPVGDFSPTIDCSWPPADLQVDPNSKSVITAPVVGNLTDDNGDGLTNTDDVPDIAFLSRTGGCCNKKGTLRIVSGECNDDGSMQEIASLDRGSAPMINDGAPALGDLDNDGVPELVVISHKDGSSTPQGVVAWQRTSADGANWEVMWRNTTYPTYGTHSTGGAVINLADLDGDANPEVIVGNVALNGQDGTLKWDGNAITDGRGGIGNNAFMGPSSAVGDIDLDGDQEVLAGNTLYDADGTELWTYQYTSNASSCGARSGLDCDGFDAIANFDDDPEGEAVIIRRGEVFVLEHDGTLLWKATIPKDDCNNNESGPPTIADFDGDGHPEIGTAGADFYAVMDMDCDPALNPNGIQDGCSQDYDNVLWAKPNQDCSSRATASSVFDFEGDGKAEMVYADEDTFRIRAGADGALLYEDTSHSSNTRIEMPVVADVDNDGNSEVVVPSRANNAITVWADSNDNWVRTRRIWNQHGYSVTNVDENGHIPAHPQPNWSNGRLNNYRQNIQPGGVFDAPDMAVDALDLGDACSGQSDVTISVEVANNGALGQSAGVAVAISATHDGNTTTIAGVETTQRLLPGQSETITAAWTVPDGWWEDGFSLSAAIDPDGVVNECDESNNTVDTDAATLAVHEPTLDIAEFNVDDITCGQTQTIDVSMTVENIGDDPIAAATPVVIEGDAAAGQETFGEVRTTGELAAGQTQELQISVDVPSQFVGVDFEVIATVDPTGEVFSCTQESTAQAEATCIPGG